MKIVAISDTHGMHSMIRIPQCDLLVHCGDVSWTGEWDILKRFNEWIGELKRAGTIKEAIVIAGNHDMTWQMAEFEYPRRDNFIYLQDSSFVYEGLKFYGFPWTPRFFEWAFMLDTEEEMAKKVALIPDDTDVLISHGPPYLMMDWVRRGEHVGCPALREWVDRHRDTLKLHVFGHIHEGYGVVYTPGSGTIFANVASVDEDYKPVNLPFEIELEATGLITPKASVK